MKILYLALVELEIYNAPRTHTIEVCENFKELGHHVLLLLPKPRKGKFNFSFDIAYVPFFGFGFFRELLYNIALCLYMIFYIIKFKPDIIYERMLSNPLCLIIAKIFGKKHFLEVNGPPFSKREILKNFFAKIEIEKTDGIIVPSPKLRNLVLKEAKIKESKIKFIPNGVQEKIFYPQDKLRCREKLGLDKNYFYLGYTGGIYFAYDFDFVFSVMDKIKNEIKDIRCLIVGPNAKENQPENVIFGKNVSYERIPLYLNSCDLCILPLNKSGIETQDFIASTKLFEYIACGKVVLVPKLTDEEIPEVFKNFIVFYKYGNEQDFIDKLKELYYNRSLLEKAKEEVDAFVKEYSWKETTKKIVEFIKKS